LVTPRINTTINQWEVLEAVARFGSFVEAATRMYRSQSTISYAIARLQEQFNAPLFETNEGKHRLTQAGKALLARAEPLLEGFRALEQQAEPFETAGETEVRISVNSIYPDDRLFASLAELARTYPDTRPKLHKGCCLSSEEEFSIYDADFCITGLSERDQLFKPIMDVRMRAVARADHPLHQFDEELTRIDLIQHLAVIIEGEGKEPQHQIRARTQPYLSVNTVESAIQAVRSGICFGWLPVYRIESLLDSGELVSLRLPRNGEQFYRMHLMMRDADPCNREMKFLANLLGAERDLEIL
jgi:DNA-binding transcriptional LysR family regulator